jgi:hypothetical protein
MAISVTAISNMTSEQLLLPLAIAIMAIVVLFVQARKNRRWIKLLGLGRSNAGPDAGQGQPYGPGQHPAESGPRVLTAEESKAELERLQKIIENKKQIARDADISHHLWGFYKILTRPTGTQSLSHYIQDGEWYEVKILQISSRDGLTKVEFELQGARYKFVDDEENQGWRENMKIFSLFLYDDSGRCLIEIPMKMKVDSSGRKYSIASGGPHALLLGGWINDFINVKLKHQSMRNKEVRALEHQERLCEIEDLKDRFGIVD